MTQDGQCPGCDAELKYLFESRNEYDYECVGWYCPDCGLSQEEI